MAGDFNFSKGQEIGDFGGLGGPGGLGDLPERWATFLKGFPGPRGRPDPQNVRFPTQRHSADSRFSSFGSVFGRTSAKLGPKTPPERRGPSCSAGFTKNQPRRPILRPILDSQVPPRQSAAMPILNLFLEFWANPKRSHVWLSGPWAYVEVAFSRVWGPWLSPNHINLSGSGPWMSPKHINV